MLDSKYLHYVATAFKPNISDAYILPISVTSAEAPSNLLLSRPPTLFLLVASSFALLSMVTYVTTWMSFHVQGPHQKKETIPPVIPYSLPYVGKALSFGVNPLGRVVSATRIAGPSTAFGMKLLGSTLYFISGRENLAKIRKHMGNITDPGIQSFCLIRVFGMAEQAVEMYNKDDSSIRHKPWGISTVKPNNRIDYHTHANFVKMLSGDGLTHLYKRWHISFSRRLAALQIGSGWIEGRDLEKFWMTPLTAALNEAMAGPILENVSPTFTEDFIEFMPYVHNLMKAVSRMFMPRTFTLRDNLNRDVKTWHAIARACFQQSDVGAGSGADSWWGLATMRERQEIFEKVDDWDYDSIAASDFGLLWGANINVHTAAIWMIIETFRDTELLRRIRAELDTVTESSENHTKWVEEFMALPLLQSVYAEILRLRVDVLTVFRDNREDFNIGTWVFPRRSLLLVPTRPAHMDEQFWNTGRRKFPLDRFWSDRFLAYPRDSESGPSRLTRHQAESSKDGSKKSQSSSLSAQQIPESPLEWESVHAREGSLRNARLWRFLP